MLHEQQPSAFHTVIWGTFNITVHEPRHSWEVSCWLVTWQLLYSLLKMNSSGVLLLLHLCSFAKAHEKIFGNLLQILHANVLELIMQQADEALAFAVGYWMTQMMCEMYENGGNNIENSLDSLAQPECSMGSGPQSKMKWISLLCWQFANMTSKK